MDGQGDGHLMRAQCRHTLNGGRETGEKETLGSTLPYPCVLSRLQNTSGRGGDRHQAPSVPPPIHSGFHHGEANARGKKKRRKEKEKWLSKKSKMRDRKGGRLLLLPPSFRCHS